jgi:hypothetical protein
MSVKRRQETTEIEGGCNPPKIQLACITGSSLSLSSIVSRG